ncbi:hypothetical protein BC834DRAFT_22495 [Gloeopeniophorella convolvens]|nr:hypothetical protein BC834DRAFT_22495 [Gloeopeniophorella convolvens]
MACADHARCDTEKKMGLPSLSDVPPSVSNIFVPAAKSTLCPTCPPSLDAQGPSRSRPVRGQTMRPRGPQRPRPPSVTLCHPARPAPALRAHETQSFAPPVLCSLTHSTAASKKARTRIGFRPRKRHQLPQLPCPHTQRPGTPTLLRRVSSYYVRTDVRLAHRAP